MAQMMKVVVFVKPGRSKIVVERRDTTGGVS